MGWGPDAIPLKVKSSFAANLSICGIPIDVICQGI